MKKDIIFSLNMAVLFIITCFVIFYPVTASSSPGSIDLSFGTAGKVTTDYNSTSDQATASAIYTAGTNAGKIVVAGMVKVGSYDQYGVARYNTNGALDSTFGTGGKAATVDLTGYFSRPWGVAIQSDDKIVVAGGADWTAPTLRNDLGVVRFNANGTLDATFGTGGKVTRQVNSSSSSWSGVAMQSDGKVVIAGQSWGTNYVGTVVRLNADGSHDGTFSSSISSSGGFSAIAVQSDGKILAAGYGNDGSNNYMAVVRFTTAGALDTSFNSSGIQLFNGAKVFGSGSESANALAIQSDGKILVGGTTNVSGQTAFAVARLNTDGSLDTTFNSTGKVILDPTTGSDYLKGIGVQSDGKIVLSGYANGPSSGNFDFLAARLNSGGTIDTSFGSNGYVFFDFGGDDRGDAGLVIQSDNNSVIAGWTGPDGPTRDFALVRLNAASTNMAYASSTVAQNTNVIAPGATGDIVNIAITMNGDLSALSATSFTCNTTGSTATADISSARLYYTGATAAFSTATPFGSAVASPSGSFTITGTQTLAEGTNYFWLAYTVASGATNGNLLDAQCTSVTVGGSARIPLVTAPAGNRQIFNILATYDINNHVPKQAGGTEFVPTNFVATGISATNLIAGPGMTVDTFYLDTGLYVYMNWTTSTSYDAGQYFQAKITPDASKQITYNKVAFTVAADNYPGGSPEYFGPTTIDLRYSTDDFATSNILLQTLTWTPTGMFEQVPFDVDISSIGTRSVPITFRWYAYKRQAGDATSGMGFSNWKSGPNTVTGIGSNVIFKGTVSSSNTAPAFVGGATGTLTVNQNSSNNNITSLLHVNDGDSGQTETWTVTAGPSNGSLSGFPTTAGSGSANIIPGSTLTYTPTAGYSGSDSFTVQVSDGIATATRTITVTVVPPPTATTGSASSISATGATLNGTVNPLNASGEVTFEYGTTIGYGTVVDAANPNHDVSGSIDINPAVTIGGLLPNTLYHFRVVIETTSGKTYGSDQTFTTLKLNQVITFPLLGDKIYGDIPFAVSASSDSLLTVSFTSQTLTECTVSGTTITIHKFGTCTIAADQSGNSTYYPAPQVLQSFTINKALLTVTPDNQARLYGQSNPAFPVTITGYVYGENATSANVTGSASGSSTATTASPVGGAYVITGSTGTLAATNYTFAAADGTLTINKAHLTVTANDQTREYGKVNPVFTTTITGFVNGEDATSATVSGTATGSSTATLTSPAGATYTITGSTGDLAAANYDFTPANGTLTVTKASQTINFGSVPITKTYGAADFGPGAAASSGLPVTYGIDTPAVGAITPAGLVHINGAGSALITASQAGDSNYLPATANQSLVVDKATLMVQANNASRPAGVANPAFTASYSGFVNGETVAVLSGTPDFLCPADDSFPAGEYPILPSPGTLASANYIFNFFPGILAVDLQSQTITFNQLPVKTYGDAPFTISATSSSANPIVFQSSNLAVATIAGNTVTIAGPGSALITASQLGTATHALAVAMQLLTVDKATLTVTADNASKLSGGPNPSFTFTATGFISPDDLLNACSGAPDLTTTAILASPAGSYPITAAAGTLVCAKYNPVFVNGVLAVGITSQNISFAPLAPVTYGDASFALSATGGASGNPVTFSSSNPAVATVSGTTLTITGAGSTTILAKQAGTDSYAPATAQQILTVNRMNLSVTADAKGRAYNVANPPLTYTYGAFAYSDTQTVLSGAPQLSTTALITSSVGSYPITVAANNLSAANYDFTFTNSTLTITQSTPVITWSNPADITYGTNLGAGQLNASFNTTGTTVYTPLSGTLLNAGPAQNLTVDFTPNDAVNYTTASKTVTINVNKAAQLITFGAAPALAVDGTAAASITASGGSGNPVVITSKTLAVCTVSGTTVTGKTVGTCTIAANQAGNSSYNDAPEATLDIAVNKGTQTTLAITGPGSMTFGDSDAAITTSGGSGSGAVSFDAGSSTACSIVAGKLHIISATGSCSITATKAGDTNYNLATSAPFSLTLNKAVQTVLAITGPGSMTFNDADAAITTSGGSGSGAVSFDAGSSTACSIVAGKLHIISATGSCSITATKAADNDYSQATSAAFAVSIAKATPTITVTPGTYTYTGTGQGPVAADVNKGGSTGVVTMSYSGTGGTVYGPSASLPTNAGSYTATATVAADSNYNLASSTDTAFTIGKAAQIITFTPPASATYGDSPINLSATGGSSGNPVVFAYVSGPGNLVGATLTIIGAGDITVSASQAESANYNAAVPVNRTIAVAKANQTIAFNAAPSVVFNGTGTVSANGGASGNTVTYSTASPGCSVVGAQVTGLAAGTNNCTIDANQAGNGNYNAAPQVSQTFSIGKAGQTITFNAAPTVVYNGTGTVSAIGGASGNAVTYSTASTDCSVVGDQVTGLAVGTNNCTIDASQAGNANYNAAPQVSQTFSIGKATPTITVTPGTYTYNTSPQGPVAANVSKGGSTGTVTMSYSGTGGTVYGPSAVLPTNVGSYTANATVAADSNYNLALSAETAFSIGKASQAITFNPPATATYGNLPISLSASGGLSGNPVTFAYVSGPGNLVGSILTITGAGDITVSASQAGDASYIAATAVQRTITVNKATPTATVSNTPLTYDGSAKAATVTCLGGGTASNILIGGLATQTNAGSYAVTADCAASSNYSAAAGLGAGNFIIDKATPTASISNSPATYSGTAQTAAVACLGGGTATLASGGSGTNAGFYAATVDCAASSNYNSASGLSAGNFVIDKAVPTATVSNTPLTYDGSAKAAIVACLGGGTASNILTGGVLAQTNAGTYAVTADCAVSSNYNAATGLSAGNLVIGNLAQSITIAATATKTYGAADYGPGATVASGLPIDYSSDNPAVATITAGGLIHIVGAGTAVITASQEGNTNYLPASAQQTLTVNKAQLTVTADNKSRAYGDADPVFTATYSGYVGGETAAVISGQPAITTTAAINSPVGSYPITPAIGSLSAANYDFTFAGGTLAVGLASQTITFNPLAAKAYGDAAFNLTAIGGGSGNPVTFTSSDATVASVSGNTVTITCAGTATITASQAGTAGSYASATAQQSLTVNKVTLTVKGQDASRAFGEANPVLTPVYSGFVNGESAAVLSGSPALTTTATISSPAGAYPLNASVGTLAAANYSFAFSAAALTVDIASQSVTFDPLPAKTYGDTAFDLSASGGGSLNPITYTSSNQAVATVSGATVTIVGAGDTTITASQAGNNNYAAATAQQTLTVNRATLTVTAQDLNRPYGTANPTFTAAYSGFVNSETEAVLAGAPTLTTTAVTTSPVGSYPIVAAVGNLYSTNYNFTYLPGNLTVSQASQTISFNPQVSATYGDPPITLSASGGASGNPVTFMVTSGSGSISGNVLTISGAGRIIITASQAGTSNYRAAPDLSRTIRIVKAEQSISALSFNPNTLVVGSSTAANAAATSGLTVSFSSRTPAVCSVNGNSVSATAAGVCTIAAIQGGDVNYNAAQAAAEITIDKAATAITLVTSANPSIAGQAVTLTATVSAVSPGAGIPAGTVTFSSPTGGNLCTAVPLSAAVASCTTSTLNTGTNNLGVSYSGNENYLASTAALSQTVQSAAPVLTVSSLSDGAVTTGTIVNISGLVTDSGSISALTINGQSVQFNPDGSFSYPLQLLAGANTITIAVTNSGGVTVTDSRTINLDTTAPNLQITNPPDNSATMSRFIDVTGTVTDLAASGPMTVSYTLNGQALQPVTIIDTAFSFTVNLADGMNTIEVTAISGAGKTSRIKRTVTYMPAFSLAISDPAADIRTARETYLLKGVVTGNTTPVTISITMGSGTFTPAVVNGNFEQQLTFSGDGVYQVRVTGSDQNSNSLTVQRNIMRSLPKANADGEPFTIADALFCLRIANGLETPQPEQLMRLDVAPMFNGVAVGDGRVDVEDVLVVLLMAVGLI